MKYTVKFKKKALDQLAAIWNASTDQAGVTAAAHWLEEAMSTRPKSFGESRKSSVVRVAHYPPLGMEFEIIEDDKKVRVLRVWVVT
jgi:hypothetical protein